MSQNENRYDYLKSLSDYELVNIFNRETSHRGWASERAYFLKGLREAFREKQISLEHLVDRTSSGHQTFSLRYPVFLREEEDGKKILIPINPFY